MAASVSGAPPLVSSGTNSATETQTQAQSGTQSQTTTGSQQTSGTGAAQNTYTPAQQQLQQEAANAATQFLQTGNLPGTFADPPSVINAYMENFNQNIAPELAAQYGAGSPEIGSQMAIGLEQLQAQLYQTQSSNFNNALNTIGNQAYTPVGQTQQQASTGTSTSNTTGRWQDIGTTVADLQANSSGLQSSFTWQ